MGVCSSHLGIFSGMLFMIKASHFALVSHVASAFGSSDSTVRHASSEQG